ncbi:Melanocortin-2 receptor accessory protein 2 [Camelus dromedarius]|uniref:Melanocortin-2 receptor accessory protein 2 n=1 Tax=Camelus dromedarius TaxID=9838 RepID=A0A5N4DJB7_CAMDR|nr:Melanocortin-2 receptor accessory protein 2 [Camelus dromedarius]
METAVLNLSMFSDLGGYEYRLPVPTSGDWGNDESRSLFHCYIDEVDHLDKAKAGIPTIAIDSDIRLQEAIRCSRWPEEEPNRLMKCDIPNFINTDQNSSFGEDDLLILESPIVLENKPLAQTSPKDLNSEMCFVKCLSEDVKSVFVWQEVPFHKIVRVCV